MYLSFLLVAPGLGWAGEGMLSSLSCPGYHRCPSKASLDWGWQDQCHQPLQVALTMSPPNNPREQIQGK